MSTVEIVIDHLRGPEDAAAFARLNEAWIIELFALEPADRKTLDDPQGAIVARGGAVLVARAGEAVVGCVALVPEGDGVFELSKMAVDPAERGRGLGRKLLAAAIAWSRDQGARELFLGSNRRLGPAVHLYEAMGFEHVPASEIGPMPYTRADVWMRLRL